MERLVIDTETTGLSPRYNKILTVGLLLVDVTKKHLEILDSNHLFIRHQNYNATPEAMSVNKINLEEHNKVAEEPETICRKINNFIDKNGIEKTPLLGHNIAFDRGFLNTLFEKENEESNLCGIHEDTMHLWRNLQRIGNVPAHLRANLQTISDHFGIDYTKAHDALADCHITAKVYQRILGISKP